MLSSHIRDLINEQIDTDLLHLTDSLSSVQTAAVEKAFHLGHQPGRAVTMAMIPEAGNHAAAIAGAIRKVLEKVHVEPYDELGGDLVRIYDGNAEAQIALIRSRLDQYHGDRHN